MSGNKYTSKPFENIKSFEEAIYLYQFLFFRIMRENSYLRNIRYHELRSVVVHLLKNDLPV